jgi:hypothetical protein
LTGKTVRRQDGQRREKQCFKIVVVRKNKLNNFKKGKIMVGKKKKMKLAKEKANCFCFCKFFCFLQKNLLLN